MMASAFVKHLQTLVECPICLEQFTEPKILPCLHSFCSKCVEKCFFPNNAIGSEAGGVTCPICRRFVELPDASDTRFLPANTLLSVLINCKDKLRLNGTASSPALKSALEEILSVKEELGHSSALAKVDLLNLRHHVIESKKKIQKKLDEDYDQIIKKLDLLENDNYNTYSHYIQNTDALLSCFQNKDLPSKGGICNLSSNRFHTNISFRSNKLLLQPNIIGELDIECTRTPNKPNSQEIDFYERNDNNQLEFMGYLESDNLEAPKTTIGLAVLGFCIYTLDSLSTSVNVYDAISLKLKTTINVPGLTHPQDMACCYATKNIFIADSCNNTLIKVDVERGVKGSWHLDFEPTNISVNSEEGRPTILVTSMRAHKLLEIDGVTGKMLRSIELRSDFDNVGHAIIVCLPEKKAKFFALCFGFFSSDPSHRVVMADYRTGKLINECGFGSQQGNGEKQVNNPSYLVEVKSSRLSRTESLLVADRCNGRILLLSLPNFKLLSSYSRYNCAGVSKLFKEPNKITYDEETKILVVAENEMQGCVLVFKTNF